MIASNTARAVLLSPLVLQTIIIAQMVSIGGKVFLTCLINVTILTTSPLCPMSRADALSLPLVDLLNRLRPMYTHLVHTVPIFGHKVPMKFRYRDQPTLPYLTRLYTTSSTTARVYLYRRVRVVYEQWSVNHSVCFCLHVITVCLLSSTHHYCGFLYIAAYFYVDVCITMCKHATTV